MCPWIRVTAGSKHEVAENVAVFVEVSCKGAGGVGFLGGTLEEVCTVGREYLRC